MKPVRNVKMAMAIPITLLILAISGSGFCESVSKPGPSQSLVRLVPKNPVGPPYTFLLTYKGYKERTDSHVITNVHFLNVTGAWFEITREGTIGSSVIPYTFLMGPRGNEPLSERIFKDIRFEKGQYLKLTAKRTTVAAYCALALDLIGRGSSGLLCQRISWMAPIRS